MAAVGSANNPLLQIDQNQWLWSWGLRPADNPLMCVGPLPCSLYAIENYTGTRVSLFPVAREAHFFSFLGDEGCEGKRTLKVEKRLPESRTWRPKNMMGRKGRVSGFLSPSWPGKLQIY